MPRSALLIAFAITACAAPSNVRKPRDQMSEREKENTIANSGLPGAGVVKKGMAMADQEAKRAAMMDSLSKDN